jgi:hypothetical protein
MLRNDGYQAMREKAALLRTMSIHLYRSHVHILTVTVLPVLYPEAHRNGSEKKRRSRYESLGMVPGENFEHSIVTYRLKNANMGQSIGG